MTDSGLSTIVSLFGSELVISLLFLAVLLGILFFILASKEFVLGIMFMLLTYFGLSGIIPLWISASFLIMIGLFFATFIWKFFFRGGG